MFGDINHTFTYQAHGHIVPRHATIIGLVEFIVRPVLDGVEVHDSTTVSHADSKTISIHCLTCCC